MRHLYLLLLLFSPRPFVGQTIAWQSIQVHPVGLNAARLSSAEKAAIRALLKPELEEIADLCVAGQPGLDDLTFDEAPLGTHSIVYVAPGWGCTGGGNSSGNWLVEIRAGHPLLLGTTLGWGLRVQPHASMGLHDFVNYWSGGGGEIGISYYRFDGTTYRSIGSHSIIPCDEGYCYKEGGRPLDWKLP
ncbi:MAG TPA: hypothetical protein VGU46_08650 [Acidobacteriaceae bacterium]|nr:hypothetical protein [Acidobacteriaceae bacterium]